MKPEIKAQWVAALRSGEYKQGKEQLRRGDEFCCLGVLCDLHRKATDGGDWHGSFYMDSDIGLSGEVAEWSGLSRTKVSIEGVADWITNHNDGIGSNLTAKSFSQIADAIEAQL